jgi:hypothetical protein
MASELKDAGTFVDSALLGDIEWITPANAADNNDVYTVATFALGMLTTHYLWGDTWGFAIPADATIDGIKVVIYRNKTGIATVSDLVVRLVKAGVVAGSNYASATAWNASPTEDAAEYGGAADMWGTTWTPAQVNASTFGIALQVQSDGIPATAQADWFTIEIFYTAAASSAPRSQVCIVRLDEPYLAEE